MSLEVNQSPVLDRRDTHVIGFVIVDSMLLCLYVNNGLVLSLFAVITEWPHLILDQ